MPVDVENLEIVHYPADVLRSKASEIKEVTDEVYRVARKMLQLMHEAPGVGLAAPQVGLSWRMFVSNATGESADDQVYINPILRNPSRDTEDYEEGCLSIPGVKAEIRRPVGITIEATDLDGNRFEQTSDELHARVWQHEFDHLDGVLIIDKMTRMDRMANRKALRELEDA